MFNQMGPLDLICDAPQYPVVQAWNDIGIKAPEDVRWVNLSHHIEPAQADEYHHSVFQKLFHSMRSREHLCSCRKELPLLVKYRFTTSLDNESTYSIGQCQSCWTVYWQEG